ncbi:MULTISPECIES: antibiotic biosynthesis monooxygenase family protein [Protofrankia]|uniref:Antibiotic biosynthesis monooxygenase n=1 Tax=Candidatus Protofrankia datiscae TaxID=2716812 RepID=F8B0H0_9ACTN|nr:MULTISPECIES: antibiotic biosynthesis monooxygenase family protein [Protofrankia]AEH09719.1 Antibiotic biosynthesis monooxygenase [Candidatus Protofrankia datiscae]
MTIRVMLYTEAPKGGEKEFEEAYRQVAVQMRGVDGHIADELLREPGSNRYLLLAEWEDERRFTAWVSDPAHTARTGPLVPYLERTFQRAVYEVAVRPADQRG